MVQDRRMKRLFATSIALSTVLFANLALAQSWSELNASQQQQLSDFQAIWAQLPDPRRAQLLASAEQIARMSPANRKKLVDSMTQAANNVNGNSGTQTPRPSQ